MTPARDGPDADRPLPCSLPAVKPVRAVARRGFDAVNQFVFPEAVSAEDQWQRISMNEAIDRHLATLGPERVNIRGIVTPRAPRALPSRSAAKRIGTRGGSVSTR